MALVSRQGYLVNGSYAIAPDEGDSSTVDILRQPDGNRGNEKQTCHDAYDGTNLFHNRSYAARGVDLPLISSKKDLRAASFLEMASMVSASCGNFFNAAMCCLTMFITNQSDRDFIQMILFCVIILL